MKEINATIEANRAYVQARDEAEHYRRRMERAERQVAAVREVLAAWDPEESPGHYSDIRRALETE